MTTTTASPATASQSSIFMGSLLVYISSLMYTMLGRAGLDAKNRGRTAVSENLGSTPDIPHRDNSELRKSHCRAHVLQWAGRC